MTPVQAYRCQYCGKLYMRAKACIKHEETLCMKNKDLHPSCWKCVHFEPYFGYGEDAEKCDEVIFESAGYVSLGEYCTKTFEPNKCTCPTDKHKLYYNIRLDKDIQAELAKHGYRPMPTPKSGGCPNFKLIKD